VAGETIYIVKKVNLAGTLNLPGFLEMKTTLSKPLPLKNFCQ